MGSDINNYDAGCKEFEVVEDSTSLDITRENFQQSESWRKIK